MNKIDPLFFTSCMAANMDFVGEAIARHVARAWDIPTAFVADVAWPEREAALDAGRVGVGWICGLPYVRKVDRPRPTVSLLAAPVMRAPRYGGQPVYFSDVVVHRDSPFTRFADLRGASWAFNEPGSHSGHAVTRYHLATLGETGPYFGRVVAAGAHQAILSLILAHRIDAGAIDSTVLELELRRRPEEAAQLRIIDSLGPSPIPPWVVSRRLPPPVQAGLRQLFLRLHEDEVMRPVLRQAGISHFVAVSDRDYDPIREMARLAERITLE